MRTLLLTTLLALAAGAAAPARADERKTEEAPKVLLSDFARGARPALVDALAEYEARSAERARLRAGKSDRAHAARILEAAKNLE